jgi:hypothetical protein
VTIETLEKNIFGHFKYLPKLLGFGVEKSKLFDTVNCGLYSSMFNIVCGANLEQWAKHMQDADSLNEVTFSYAFEANYQYGDDFVESKIREVIQYYNNQPFAWWLGPSTNPVWISNILQELNFEASLEQAMILDLMTIEASISPIIAHVTTPEHLEHFIQILEPYDPSARRFYKKLKNPLLYPLEKLFVGYESNIPVVIGTLYIDEENSMAGIFNVLTSENKRCLGYGTQMMNHLLSNAKGSNIRYASLCASSESGYRIYERLGFQSVSKFGCFEWKGYDS